LVLIAAMAVGAQDAPKLGDSYAKAALLALKAIQGNLSDPQRPSREAEAENEKIDAADVEGSTDGEQQITRALKKFRIDHTVNLFVMKLVITVNGDRLDQYNPTILEIKRKEDACAVPLEKNLRERMPSVPPECESVSVAVDSRGRLPKDKEKNNVKTP